MKAAAILALLLTGCAYISGPCEVVTAPEKRAACQQGGSMLLMPGSVLRVLATPEAKP